MTQQIQNHYDPMHGGNEYSFDDFSWDKKPDALDEEKAPSTADFLAAAPEVDDSEKVGAHTPWQSRIKTGFDAQGHPNYLKNGNELIEGIYMGIPNELYHALPALSSSMLKTFATSPAHYNRNYISNISRKRSDALQRTLDTGTLSHELVLEPHDFYDKYCCAIDPLDHKDALKTIDSLSKKCAELSLKKTGKKEELISRLIEHDPKLKRIIWDCIVNEHETINAEKIVVDHIVWADAIRSGNTTLAHPMARQLFSKGLPELTIISYCPIHCMWLKCRPDWLRYDLITVDYKTTRDASPKFFAKQSKELNYPLQQEFYKLVMSLQDIHVTEFLFVANEYTNADICQIYDLDEEWTEEAHIQTISLLEELAKCVTEDAWYGYDRTNEIQTLRQPWRTKARKSSLLAQSSGAIITAINDSIKKNPFKNT
jgi:hypothetical protein